MEKKDAFILTVATIILLAFGAIALYSAGAQNLQGRQRLRPDAPPATSPSVYVQRQAIVLCGAVIPFFFIANTDYRRLLAFAPWGLVGFCLLLGLCFVEPIGQRINGAARWISFGPVSFQPSEFSKLALVFFLAYWFQRIGRRAAEFLHGFVIPGLAVGTVAGLVLLETDFGTGVLMLLCSGILMFIGGTRLRYLLVSGLIVIVALAFFLLNSPERRSRIEAFLNPEQAADESRQQTEGINAIGSGGAFGVGLGKGRQKLLYVPFSHTDFIFTIIGEEMGLVGTLSVVFAFLLIAVSGTSISIRAPDKAGLLVGMGATLFIVLQAIINLGVTTGLTPNKGLPLPFVSFGGSNLLLSICFIAVLISIHRQTGPRPLGEVQAVLYARTGRLRPPGRTTTLKSHYRTRARRRSRH